MPRRRHRSNKDKHARKGGGRQVFHGPAWDRAEFLAAVRAGHLRVGMRGEPTGPDRMFLLVVLPETFDSEPSRMNGWIDIPPEIWLSWAEYLGLWPYWIGKHSKSGQSYFTRLHSDPKAPFAPKDPRGGVRKATAARSRWVEGRRDELWRTQVAPYFHRSANDTLAAPSGPAGPGPDFGGRG